MTKNKLTIEELILYRQEDGIIPEGDAIIEAKGITFHVFIPDSDLLYALDEGKIKVKEEVELDLNILPFFVMEVDRKEKTIKKLSDQNHVNNYLIIWKVKEVKEKSFDIDCGILLTVYEKKNLNHGTYVIVIGRIDMEMK